MTHSTRFQPVTGQNQCSRRRERGGAAAPLAARARTENQRVTGRYPKLVEKDDATHRLKG